jgi:hypothetical protein
MKAPRCAWINFAERARRELLTVDETGGRRTIEVTHGSTALTSQEEAQVGRARQGQAIQSGDRRLAVHQRADGPVSPEQGVRQTGHQLPGRASPGAARRQGSRAGMTDG